MGRVKARRGQHVYIYSACDVDRGRVKGILAIEAAFKPSTLGSRYLLRATDFLIHLSMIRNNSLVHVPILSAASGPVADR